MKNVCKGLLIALVAAATCGVVTAPKASAYTTFTTEYRTLPSVVDYGTTFDNPVILNEPAVIDSDTVISPTIITEPSVIRTEPMIWPARDRRHLFHLGVPGLLNLNMF